MLHKTSPHLMHHPPFAVIIPLIQKLRPAVIKSLGSAGYLANLADSLKNVLDYEPRFVARFWWEGGIGTPNNFQPLQDAATVQASGQLDFSPGRAYELWRDQVGGELSSIAGRDNFYVESFNEVGISREYLQFERERTARLYQGLGLRSLVANLGVGWSAPHHFEMARETALILALRNYGGAWGEHGYGSVLGLQMYHGPLNQAVQADGRLGRSPKEMAFDKTIYPDTVASWLAMRASMSHQSLLSVGGGDIPIIISEFGFDDAGFHSYRHYTGGAAVSAWRECIPYWQNLGYLENKSAEQFYGEQLAWAEAQAAIYPWLMGMTVFTVGSDPASRWALYDVLDTSVFDHFLAALGDMPSEPDPPDEEEPEPPPEEENGEDEIMVKPIGVVYRDHSKEQIEASVTGFESSIFTSMGEPRYAAAAKVADFIARIWFEFNASEGARGLPDYGNPDTFMSKLGGLPISTIVDDVLLEATILKNYITEVAHYYISGNSPEHPEIPTGVTRKFENANYSRETIIEVLNGDQVGKADLANYFAVQALALERLHVYTDPATRQQVERDLRGAVVNRNIALDEDRDAFWALAVNRGLLNAVADYAGVIQLKRIVTGRIAGKRERDVLPIEDMSILAQKGFGGLPVVLQVEYADGWQSQGISAEQAAADLWLLAKAAEQYPNLQIIFFLRQAGPSGDWGDFHDIRGNVEMLYLDYLHGERTPPAVDWAADDGQPPDDPPDEEEPEEPPVEEGPIATFTVSGRPFVGSEMVFTPDARLKNNDFEWRVNGELAHVKRVMRRTFDAAGTYAVELTVTSGGVSATHTETFVIAVEGGEQPGPSGDLLLDWLRVELEAAKFRVGLLEQVIEQHTV